MTTKTVLKALVCKDGNILCLRRSNTDVRRPLQWDLPGGGHDEGEDLIAGVEREILEEAGLAVRRTTPIYSVTEIRNWKDDKGEHTDNVVFIFFVSQAEEEAVKLSYEHDRFAWVTIDEAIDMYEYPLHKQLLSYVRDNNLLAQA